MHRNLSETATASVSAVDTVLAANANSYHSYGAEAAYAGIVAAGYRYVELLAVPGWTEHVTFDRPLDLLGFDLTPVSLSAHSDLTTAAGLAHGLRAVAWAAENGIAIVNTAIGGHAGKEEDESAFLATIGPLADAAEAAGVTLTLEIHGDLMASGARTVELFDRLDRDSVKVNYDTGNVWHYAGVRAEDDLPLIADRLAHVHLKDTRSAPGIWDFPPLGEGDVDFAAILAVLRAAGYAGPLSVELEFQGEPWPPLADVTAGIARSREHLLALGL
jgi:sugar phosphate isomerase/epimerase